MSKNPGGFAPTTCSLWVKCLNKNGGTGFSVCLVYFFLLISAFKCILMVHIHYCGTVFDKTIKSLPSLIKTFQGFLVFIFLRCMLVSYSKLWCLIMYFTDVLQFSSTFNLPSKTFSNCKFVCFYTPVFDGTYYGIASSVRPSVCLSGPCRPNL